jgi:Uma2 family endonuclease
MSASQKPIGLDEFLAWEREQPLKYEFDGTQPNAMTGGSPRHSLIGARLITALGNAVRPPCEVYQSDVKVMTAFGTRVRYPDASISCTQPDENGDSIEPVVVFEVSSPSTRLTDSRVKALEYQQTPSVMAYVMLAVEERQATVMRRTTAWQIETTVDLLHLPEVGITVSLDEIYR